MKKRESDFLYGQIVTGQERTVFNYKMGDLD